MTSDRVEYAISLPEEIVATWMEVADDLGILVRNGCEFGITDGQIGLEGLVTGYVIGLSLPDVEYFLIVISKRKVDEEQATRLVDRLRRSLRNSVRCFRAVGVGQWKEI